MGGGKGGKGEALRVARDDEEAVGVVNSSAKRRAAIKVWSHVAISQTSWRPRA